MSLKIVVSGKGGVGKTTITALLSLIFSDLGYQVIALDSDSVPNLALSLGLPPDEASKIVPLARNDSLIERKTGVRPGEGWGVLFSLNPSVEDILEKYSIEVRPRLRLVVVGSVDSGKSGCLCPALALARAFLLYVLSKVSGIVIVDSEAGAEVFGRGLAEKFDVNLCVAEPTLRSLLIARKLIELARDLHIRNNILVLNKVTNEKQALDLARSIIEDSATEVHVVHYDEKLLKVEQDKSKLPIPERDSIAYRDVSRIAQALLRHLG